MATKNLYGLDANGNAIPIADPGAVRQGDVVALAADAQRLGGLLPEEFAKFGETGIHMELLWTNASPNSDFAAQKIAIALGEVDGVIIIFGYDNSLTGYENSLGGSVFVGKECFGFSTIVLTYQGKWRQYIVQTDGIDVTSGFLNGTAQNSVCIPIKIYGIKGVA